MRVGEWLKAVRASMPRLSIRTCEDEGGGVGMWRGPYRGCLQQRITNEQISHKIHISCSGRALCRPRKQRTINEHQFLTHPNIRDARSSVRKRRQATNIHCSGRALCRPRTSEQSTSINSSHILIVGTLVRASATNEQSTSINSSHILTVGTLVRASANVGQATNIHCSGRALCRPRKRRTIE